MNENLEEVAAGQKIIIYTIIANFLVGVSQRSTPELGMMISIVAILVTVAAIYGVYRLCTGLGYSIGIKIVLMILMFIPLVNLITLVILSFKATKKLRGAGYEVGLLGVK